jgi:hypothetical protein
MVDNQFVEFLYPEEALKQHEKFFFLIEKYKRNREELRGFKEKKISELASFLEVLEALEKELANFKKLMPKESSATTKESYEESEPVKRVKKVKKKKRIKKKAAPKAKRELDSLKFGLEKIRDELENM